MSLRPATFEAALASHKPMKRSPMKSSRKPLKASGGLKARKRTTKRKKVRTRKSLIKGIDAVVFKIICLMYPSCVECGSDEKPTTGHVLSRRSYATRWDYRNVFRQCWPCNYKAAMTAAASYHLWYVKRFGVAAFDELYRDWAKGRKYTRLELEDVLVQFQQELNTLEYNLQTLTGREGPQPDLAQID